MKPPTLLLLLAMLMGGCEDSAFDYRGRTKPFVITSKSAVQDNAMIFTYYFLDANNKLGFFDEEKNRYSIGDTIK